MTEAASEGLALRLVRDIEGVSCTHGSLYVNGVFQCYTLEDTDRKMEAGGTKVYAQTAVPRGNYKLVLDLSTRFGKIMPHILNVPGFSGIRIHAGNTDKDTEGCILVGTVRTVNAVRNSRIAYGKLMTILEDAFARNEPITITIE